MSTGLVDPPAPTVAPWENATPDPRVLAGVSVRARDTATLGRFTSQGDRCGWCTQPIRLAGTQSVVDRSTGEIVHIYSTGSEPDGVLLKACGTRRATRCPSCASTYAADARMLVRSGISGGKGIPESVSRHPMVFATLTAPSFGPVHRSPKGGRQTCRPGARGRKCPHGRPLFCAEFHAPDDPAVGEPLCADCYDYPSAVLWNATCPELWRRTTIYVRRELARLVGITVKRLGELVRLSFTKVAEYQRRGVVHLHAVIRLDGVGDDRSGPGASADSENRPAPPASFDVSTLSAAIRTAVARVSAPLPTASPDGAMASARWGSQIDVRTIVDGKEITPRRAGERGLGSIATGARAVANYVAKYATKSTDDTGALDRRLHSLSDLGARGVTGHLRRMVETAWNLGAQPELAKLRHWAHTLGFGGHWLTKSRRYSVTFAFLRAERQAWQVRRHSHPKAISSDAVVLSDWEWVGTGWRTVGDAWMAVIGRREKADSKIESREARCLAGAPGYAPWDASGVLVIGDPLPLPSGAWP